MIQYVDQLQLPRLQPGFDPYLGIAPGSVDLWRPAPVGIADEHGMGAQIGPDPGRPANPYPSGQCTWGVWQYVADHFGVYMPDLPGNATDWFDDAQQKGWKTTSEITASTIVCWSNGKYPPFGHVAFVTSVDRGTTSLIGGIVGTEQSKPVTFTVDEYNFTTGLGHDTRTIKADSPNDAAGIRGFIEVPGVTPGVSAGTQVNSQPSDPWSEFNAGLKSVEDQLQQDLKATGDKVWAGAQIGAGLLVMAGGVTFTVLALRTPGAAQAAVAGGVQAGRSAVGRTQRKVVPVAQAAVLGPPQPVAGGTPGARVTRAGLSRMLPR